MTCQAVVAGKVVREEAYVCDSLEQSSMTYGEAGLKGPAAGTLQEMWNLMWKGPCKAQDILPASHWTDFGGIR